MTQDTFANNNNWQDALNLLHAVCQEHEIMQNEKLTETNEKIPSTLSAVSIKLSNNFRKITAIVQTLTDKYLGDVELYRSHYTRKEFDVEEQLNAVADFKLKHEIYKAMIKKYEILKIQHQNLVAATNVQENLEKELEVVNKKLVDWNATMQDRINVFNLNMDTNKFYWEMAEIRMEYYTKQQVSLNN